MSSLNEQDILKIIEFKENKLTLNELRKIIKIAKIKDLYYNVSDEFIVIIVLEKLGRIVEIKINDLERR